MLDKIFDVMFSSGALQFFGAFLWGIASVILSPCGISIIPLVVGYVSNTENPSRPQALKISCAFCLGIIFNLVLAAFIISGIGQFLPAHALTLITGIIFIVMGLHLTGIINVKIFALGSRVKGTEPQNIKGAIILGIVSGLAVGPCSIAYVSPVLSLAISQGFNGIMLILSYALGYSFVLISAGTFTQIFTGFLQSERGDKILRVINILCGLGLILGGAYFIYELRFLV